MTKQIGYKRIGLSYAEQINIVNIIGNTAYYIAQKGGHDFGGIHTVNTDRLITEQEANESKRVYK